MSARIVLMMMMAAASSAIGMLSCSAASAMTNALAAAAPSQAVVDLSPSESYSNFNLFIPKDVQQVLHSRKEKQERDAAKYQAYRAFSFVDRYVQSGIQFTNHIVEDASKYFKPAHYDHGTGMAVADVDGDGLPDIYFVNQLGSNGLWRNLGNGRFENITESAGVALDHRICVTAAFADIDNDGDPDLFVTTVRHGNVLFENLGGGKFRDISKEAGVDYLGHSSGAVFFDFNNDGLLDLFVCNIGQYTSNETGEGGYYRALPDAFSGHTKPERGEQSLLYLNLGGKRFKEVSREMNLQHKAFSGDATFCDVNGDGFPDLYVLSMQGDDHLYLNQNGKRFEERTADFFPKTPWGAMGIKFFDFNNDGLLDLFVTDMHSDMTGLETKITKSNFGIALERVKSEPWCTTEFTQDYLNNSSNNIFGNAFYRNSGNGRHDEISDSIGVETLWPWGVSVGDINADGYPDAFVTAGMGYGFRYGVNSLLMNEAGKEFFSSEFLVGIEPRFQGRTQKIAFVLDCSGADKDNPYCRNRTGQVPIFEALSSRSSAMVDIDNDGDLDLIVNEMDDRPQILISDLSERRSVACLKIRLQGTASNRDGLGAIVKVHSGGRTYTQQNDGKSGYLAQSSLPLYFGLGDAKAVDSVEVSWPSGRKQTVTDHLQFNSTLVVTEPAAKP